MQFEGGSWRCRQYCRNYRDDDQQLNQGKGRPRRPRFNAALGKVQKMAEPHFALRLLSPGGRFMIHKYVAFRCTNPRFSPMKDVFKLASPCQIAKSHELGTG